MSFRMTSIACASVAALVSMMAGFVPAEAVDADGPPLQTPTATLDSALSCSSDLASSTRTPVLLVPGTIETAQQAYSWGYQKVLRESGIPVCTVALPANGIGDMQVTVEYVVRAIRTMNDVSGRKISVVGHSQGGLLPAWAVRFWPDLAERVDDIVALDAPYGGSSLVDVVCGFDSCPPLAWQVTRGSDWSRALRRFPVPQGVSVTSIGSRDTDLIKPSPDATALPGATQVIIQDLCPGRYVGHMDQLSDAVSHAIVIDALTHPGAANANRVGTAICASEDFAGIDQVARGQLVLLVGGVLEALFSGSFVDREPPLRGYAVGLPGDTNVALGRPVTVSSTEGSLIGSNAVDGQLGTRWGSDWWHDPEWISVDLGTQREIHGVQISWEAAYATKYAVQYWNGSSWVTAKTVVGTGDHEFIPISAMTTRYVRILGLERARNYGYSLWELQIYGK